MPFLPTFNDLKNVSLSINPLNLFSDAPRAPESTSPETGVGEAGPGPSSLASRTNRQQSSRPELKSESGGSSSSSLDGENGSRKASGLGVSIHEEERPKRERKKRVQMDSYIIVKPPPTASKNALNLQIQLVVNKGNGRPRSDSTATTNTASRSPSVFSDPTSPPFSALSTPAAVGTPSRITLGPVISPTIEGLDRKRSDSPGHISSDEASVPPVAGPTSALRRVTSRKSSSGSIPLSMTSTSGQKRIQPMFNLNVHNVMSSSVVTDAGTDAKVAKFGKRNIDIVDVGILEPTEIWQVAANSSALFPPTSALEESRSRPMSMYSLTTPISPSATRITEENSRPRGSIDLKSLRPEILQEGGAGAKRFFGKLGGAFKKKTAAERESAHQPSLMMAASPTPSTGAFPASSTGMMRGGSKEGIPLASSLAVGPPTFGCSPNVIARRASSPKFSTTQFADGLAPPDSASINSTIRSPAPSNRPIGYSWTVKRWAKRNTDGWAAHLVAAVAQGVSLTGGVGGEGEDEVVFEWTKLRCPTVNNPRSRRNSTASRGHSRPPSSATVLDSAESPNRMLQPTPAPSTPKLSASRPAPIRRTSATSSLSPHNPETALPVLPDDNSAIYHTAEEDDSDPEDSEIPWQCTLVVASTGKRQILGTLTPAPHHPKVVGQLRLPVRLEPICLADLSGDDVAVQKAMKEVCLSEEAFKDVVCVTALWLVAREGWNGLGKVRRGR